MLQDDSDFYFNIKPLSNFSQVADINKYYAAPESWFVLIADIKGSTIAIDEGRYKDVNLIGAACINAVLNACNNDQIPYVFGGDGATLLAPTIWINKCKQALLKVKAMAEKQFQLVLRVGVVSVREINSSERHKVMVAKHSLSQGNNLAAFSGGGVELAEQWIKTNETYLVSNETSEAAPDLSGLSCRWESLPAKNDVMFSLLIRVLDSDAHKAGKLYKQIINDISNITDNEGYDSKPVALSNLSINWPPTKIKNEIKATLGGRNIIIWTIKLYLNSLLQFLLDRYDVSIGAYKGKAYRAELISNTDYCRFDDTLRMLLDCTQAQCKTIEIMLQNYADKNLLTFGVHKSGSALMTCLVFDLDKKQHIHFVDGNDGGFTSAAKAMKALNQSKK